LVWGKTGGDEGVAATAKRRGVASTQSQLHGSGAAASATGAHAGESPAGRIGRFTTDSLMPVPPRGWEGKADGELNRQAVMKMNHNQ
jgi:hypothetical protein